jgi:hypothetical protein
MPFAADVHLCPATQGIPFAIIINLIIPGNPLLGIVATFATEQVGQELAGV